MTVFQINLRFWISLLRKIKQTFNASNENWLAYFINVKLVLFNSIHFYIYLFLLYLFSIAKIVNLPQRALHAHTGTGKVPQKWKTLPWGKNVKKTLWRTSEEGSPSRDGQTTMEVFQVKLCTVHHILDALFVILHLVSHWRVGNHVWRSVFKWKLKRKSSLHVLKCVDIFYHVSTNRAHTFFSLAIMNQSSSVHWTVCIW